MTDVSAKCPSTPTHEMPSFPMIRVGVENLFFLKLHNQITSRLLIHYISNLFLHILAVVYKFLSFSPNKLLQIKGSLTPGLLAFINFHVRMSAKLNLILLLQKWLERFHLLRYYYLCPLIKILIQTVWNMSRHIRDNQITLN